MNIDTIINYISEYGNSIIFLLVFIEYLNIPGYPGGFALPAAGIVVRLGQINFWGTFLLSFFAAILSLTCVYFVCIKFHKIIKNFFTQNPKLKNIYDKTETYTNKYGKSGLFIARIIPVVRTFISIPCGILKINFTTYILYSSLGTAVNTILMMGLGYFLTSLFI